MRVFQWLHISMRDLCGQGAAAEPSRLGSVLSCVCALDWFHQAPILKYGFSNVQQVMRSQSLGPCCLEIRGKLKS